MSKSYFERRIFGHNGQDDSAEDQAPSLGSLKTGGAPTPSQPYRFRASREDQPVITSRQYEQAQARQRAQAAADPAYEQASEPGWEASAELQRRLGHEPAPAPAPTASSSYAPEPPHWDAQTDPAGQTAEPFGPADMDQPLADQEQMMDEITGQQAVDPYGFSGSQPMAPAQEPTFGFHTNEGFEHHEQTADTGFEEQALHAASVATTATHAEHQGATPETAITEPRVASTAGVRVGQPVNLSDQRSGSSVQPNLYISADDRIGSAAPTRAHRDGSRGDSVRPQAARPDAPRREPAGQGNPLAGAAAFRGLGKKPAAPSGQNGRSAVSSMPPRRLSNKQHHPHRSRKGGGFFALIRNGAMVLALLFTVGVALSVSYAGLQRLGKGRTTDIPVLLAAETPVKLTPEEAGLSPDFAAGRTFEGDLTVLSNPRGVLEPSDERFANDAQEAPTIAMNFGGQSIIVPQVDTSQQPPVLDPMANIIAASSTGTLDPLTGNPVPVPALETPLGAAATGEAQTAAATTQPAPSTTASPTAAPAPTVPLVEEEPLAALSPLANGLRDLPNPQVRGAVPETYKGLALPVQANAGSGAANPSTTTGAAALNSTPSLSTAAGVETALVSGQRGSASPTAVLDPATGLPTTPQTPNVSGGAVVMPFGIQLASMRTEEQARNLWLTLQQKYPRLLGGLASQVVRFDSGSRGVFYRLQAGPMPTKATAQDFCVQLKTAGQECIFVRG